MRLDRDTGAVAKLPDRFKLCHMGGGWAGTFALPVSTRDYLVEEAKVGQIVPDWSEWLGDQGQGRRSLPLMAADPLATHPWDQRCSDSQRRPHLHYLWVVVDGGADIERPRQFDVDLTLHVHV